MKAAAALLQAPLIRNGYSLVASAAITSALGVVFWILAARLYAPEQVGLGSVLVSTMVTLSSASQLNFGNMLNRYVPRSGRRGGQLIVAAYGAASLTALIGAIGFVVFAHAFLPHLDFLTADALLLLWFTAAVVAWTLFALQDSALAGLRQAAIVPLENAVYSISKIVLLVLFAGFAATAVGLFAAWTLPVILMVIAVNIYIFRRGLAAPDFATTGHLPSRPELLRFFGWDYTGSLMLTAAMGVAPLLVLNAEGPAASASYYLAWTITYSLYLIGRSMSISLVSEISAHPRRLPALTADAVVHTMVPLAGTAALVSLGAPLLMSLFGQSYAAEGATLLSVLALAAIPWGGTTLFLGFARARDWPVAVPIVQGTTLVLSLGSALVLLPMFGLLGMGLAWLLAHTLVLAGIAGWLILRSGGRLALESGLRLGSASARALHKLLPGKGPKIDKAVTQVIASLQPADGPKAVPVSLTTVNEGAVWSIDRGAAGRSILKVAGDAERGAALLRGSEQLEAMAADGRLAEYQHLLPKRVAARSSDNVTITLETALPGVSGPVALPRAADPAPLLEAAVVRMRAMHTATSCNEMADAQWLDQWIIAPAGLLDHLPPALLGEERRRELVARVVAELADFWKGRSIRSGLVHGDFSPGNVLYAEGSSVVTGLIDWEGAATNGPAGLDSCHLAITSRMLESGDELGLVVAPLLRHAAWSASETSWLAKEDWSHQLPSSRKMVLLAWLSHVAGNLRKSRRYGRSWLWSAVNVDLVLLAAGEQRHDGR